MMSFVERGGGWVLAQLALFALYVLALVATPGIIALTGTSGAWSITARDAAP